MKKADIGLIGLAVMGENLVMNMESKGFTVAVYNRTAEKVTRFVEGRARGKNIIGTYSIEELAASLEKPRKVMLMVKAGQPVDDFIEKVIPHLEKGDIIIDGGNSHFPDTIRRTAYVESKGLYYIGTGVSGGEEGALKGPSMMPGGSPEAWPYVKPIFQAICAKVARFCSMAIPGTSPSRAPSRCWTASAAATALWADCSMACSGASTRKNACTLAGPPARWPPRSSRITRSPRMKSR